MSSRWKTFVGGPLASAGSRKKRSDLVEVPSFFCWKKETPPIFRVKQGFFLLIFTGVFVYLFVPVAEEIVDSRLFSLGLTSEVCLVFLEVRFGVLLGEIDLVPSRWSVGLTVFFGPPSFDGRSSIDQFYKPPQNPAILQGPRAVSGNFC